MAELSTRDQLEKDVFDFVRTSEEAVLTAGRGCAEAIGNLFPVEVPAVRGLVKGLFDFSEEVLKAQREFAQNMVEKTLGAVGSSERSLVSGPSRSSRASKGSPAGSRTGPKTRKTSV